MLKKRERERENKNQALSRTEITCVSSLILFLHPLMGQTPPACSKTGSAETSMPKPRAPVWRGYATVASQGIQRPCVFPDGFHSQRRASSLPPRHLPASYQEVVLAMQSDGSRSSPPQPHCQHEVIISVSRYVLVFHSISNDLRRGGSGRGEKKNQESKGTKSHSCSSWSL